VTWFSLRVHAQAHREEVVAALFAAGAQGVHEDGSALVTSFPDEREARAAVSAALAADPGATADISPAPDIDWSTAWRDHARMVSLGRLTLAPPWLAEGLPADTTVVIEPGMAFGTGEHGSTQGAAKLLERLVRPGMTVADLGSGSAILSIVAARLGAARVWAIEIDPDAQENAATNIGRNGVGDVVHPLEGDATALLPIIAPVDAMVANILSSVITPMLPVMAASLRPGGQAVLAGMLVDEASQMRDVFTRGGWEEIDSLIEEGWWSVRVQAP
jgi:ribosomal protein L11 methyltransferase